SSIASVSPTRLDNVILEPSALERERRGSEGQAVEKTFSPEESKDQDDKGGGDMDDKANEADKTNWKILREWTLPSKPGNERLAMEQVVEAVQLLKLPARRIEQLKTAVAEATMNAMEHGNHYLPDRPVSIKVLASKAALSVRITDHGGTRILPSDPGNEVPDIEAKLAELQTRRGWGLF